VRPRELLKRDDIDIVLNLTVPAAHADVSLAAIDAGKHVYTEKPLAIYEGETELKATLKADKSVKPGQRSISARLRIQACDEQVCYPPGTLELAIPVNIK